MSDQPDRDSLAESLLNHWQAGHQAATNKPSRDELDTEFRAWFAEAAGSPRSGLSINESVHARMD